VVAINAFPADTDAELALVEKKCKELGVNVALSQVWAKGGEGGTALAEEVVRLCDQDKNFTFSYEDDMSIEEKIEAIAKKVYHAAEVNILPAAQKQIDTLAKLGFSKMPVCRCRYQQRRWSLPAMLWRERPSSSVVHSPITLAINTRR
jgi:formate--tetrahydrofolate ligase